MTKNQERRLGTSGRGVRLLIAIRRYERDNHGIGPRPADVLPEGAGAAWWGTWLSLERKGLIVPAAHGRVRTAGVARSITSSWWGNSPVGLGRRERSTLG